MSLRVFGERAAESSGSALARTARVLVKSSPCLSVSVVFEFPRSFSSCPSSCSWWHRARSPSSCSRFLLYFSHRPHAHPIALDFAPKCFSACCSPVGASYEITKFMLVVLRDFAPPAHASDRSAGFTPHCFLSARLPVRPCEIAEFVPVVPART